MEALADKCVYLMSGQASAQLIIVAQRKLETQLDGLKIKYVKVDGMEPDNKEIRKELWAMGECKPGTYPLVVDMKKKVVYQGDDLQVMMDNNELVTALSEYVEA